MKIEHVGLWVTNLEEMRTFYEKYFDAKVGELYHNAKTGFSSYFLSFSEGARLEIMTRADVQEITTDEKIGFAHLAIALKSKESVDLKVEDLVNAGYNLLNGPRTTGDGYYEAVIEDPEKNRIEITTE